MILRRFDMPLDPLEFERLCTENRRAVLSYAYNCSRDWDAAEDIVQETLTIAFEKRDQYFPEANFGGWLISIARNVWFRERDRRRLRTPATSFIDDNAAYLFDEAAYQDSAWAEESRALQGCLKKLNATDQELIRAHFSEHKKYAEIAEARERTVSWVKVRMHRARIALLDCVRLALGTGEGRTS
jgi:RNA polymerase sigma-70 factor (ECF subfamily)